MENAPMIVEKTVSVENKVWGRQFSLLIFYDALEKVVAAHV